MKVCIVTGGKGSRLGDLTKFYDKSMLPIGKKPALSFIIEQYPIDSEYVIILGFGGDYIRQFLSLAYPDRRFTFVRADDNEKGDQKGLTHALLCAKDKLQEPFIFQTNDTLYDAVASAWLDIWGTTRLKYNTMLMSDKWADTKTYRSVGKVKGFDSYEILDKMTEVPLDIEKIWSYIGVAFINDWQEFWEALEGDSEKETGEVVGLKYLFDEMKDMLFLPVDSWYDLGDLEKYQEAVRDLSDFKNLSKAGEAIYFIKDKVLKFSVDKEFITKRVQRAELLKGVVPRVFTYTENFYVYIYEDGALLSDITTTPKVIVKLLDFCESTLWQLESFKKMTPLEMEKFYQKCFSFYYEKTVERINSYFQKYNLQDKDTASNDERIPPVLWMVDKIDWMNMRHGIPCRFHGDLHFENILKQESKFIFLDWRQDFVGLMFGDLYYDLAKLLHGLILSDDLVRKEGYKLDSENFWFLLRSDFYILARLNLKSWAVERGYDWTKVETLTSLIFLNMASLHDYPVSKLLFNLGRWSLYNILREEGKVK